jgi:hypothetical protein
VVFRLQPQRRMSKLHHPTCETPCAPTASCGQAYYDLLTIENRTLEDRQDTVH